MLETLILSILSAIGFITAWTQTELKAHLCGLLQKNFRGHSAEEITTMLYSYGAIGELLNCKYCLSAWTGLFFFLLYSVVSTHAAFLFTAFFSLPAFVYLLFKDSKIYAEVNELETETPSTITTHQSETNTVKPSPSENPLLQNPENHKKILMENKDIFAMLVSPNNCNFDGCAEIVAEYQKELKELEDKATAEGVPCPECKKGTVVNKYFYKLLRQRDDNQTHKR